MAPPNGPVLRVPNEWFARLHGAGSGSLDIVECAYQALLQLNAVWLQDWML